MTYPKEIIFDTIEILETVCPQKILIIGDSIKNIADDYKQQCNVINKECAITTISASVELSDSAYLSRYDLAIVAEVIETKDKQQSEHIFGRLRDLCTPKIILLCETENTDWNINEFYGFGFAMHAAYGEKQAQKNPDGTKPAGQMLFHYNIDSYKKTPDWFNPKNWANPDLWNKFWW